MVSLTRLHRGSLDKVNQTLLPIDKTNLVGYWPFWENTGTTLYDESKKGNDGTINGATWIWNSVQSKPALDFDGTDDSVNMGTSTSLNQNVFTVLVWVNPDSISDEELVNKWSSGSVGWWVKFWNGVVGEEISVRAKDPAGDRDEIRASPGVTTGSWQMVGGRRDSTYPGAGALDYIYNGTVGHGTEAASQGADDIMGTMDFRLGYNIDQAVYADVQECLVMYFDVALSDSEIAQIYNKTKP